jgi:hypothetical protein
MDYPATWKKIDDLCALMDKSRAKMEDLRKSIVGKALREGQPKDRLWALGIKRDAALVAYRRETASSKQRHDLRIDVERLSDEMQKLQGEIDNEGSGQGL